MNQTAFRSAVGALLVVGLLVVGGLACFGSSPPESPPEAPKPTPVSAPEPQEVAPKVEFALPEREVRTPAPITKGQPALAKDLARIRKTLHQVVTEEARDPYNPWAVGHALLALGPDVELSNGKNAVDWLFSEYAQPVKVGEETLLTFPAMKGAIRVEPHSDLLLKAFTEIGLEPTREVKVGEQTFTLADLYRHSLWRAWIKGTSTGFRGGNFNDAPWALQGLATWAPPGLAWRAKGGRNVSLAYMTHILAEVLREETKEMRAAMEAGTTMQKDTRRGLFRYTCGGQHLLQGVAYNVARGFHIEDGSDNKEICRQLDLMVWRIDVELDAIDPHIRSGERPIKVVLLSQRMKFLGHALETVHKIGALGLCPLDDKQVKASQRVARELVFTVDALNELGILSTLKEVRKDRELGQFRPGGAEQLYLDLVGDAAHAVRGIDLATGKGTVRY